MDEFVDALVFSNIPGIFIFIIAFLLGRGHKSVIKRHHK